MDECNSEFTNTFRIFSSIQVFYIKFIFQINPEFILDLSENDLKVLDDLVGYSPNK